MKWNQIASVLLALAFAGGLHAQDEPKEQAEAPKKPIVTPREQVSYTIGLNVGGSLVQQGFNPKEMELDIDVVLEGIRDALTRTEPRLTRQQMQEAMALFEQQMEIRQSEQEAKMKVAAEKNKKTGETFLAENAKKEGIKSTASGLQYQVLEQADGPKPKATDVVKVHYRGTTLDGEQFDSSYDRNEPAVFPLNRVIPGWTEGVQLMTVGSKYKFFIPSDLAYGERGSPPRIEPNSTLIFEVELLGIEEAQ